ncbi:MAG: DUF4249 domain-containing protein [Salinivirgaceae bacterium]|nr:DUF4249 domain-containing protein [Salinivirgaceae bacterium]
MKNIIYLFVFMAFTCFCVSCGSYANLDLPDPDIKPVIQAYPTINECLKISITPSYSIMDYNNGLNEIILAEVDLFVNGNFEERLLCDGDFYHSTFIPKPDDTLRIEFINNAMAISSQTIIPKPISIENHQFSHNTFIDNYGDSFSELTVCFKDIRGEANFYEVLVFHTYYNEETREYKRSFPMEYKSRHPSILSEEILQYEPRSLLFNDHLFNTDSINIGFAFDRPYPSYPEKYCNSTIYLLHVTEAYYRYKQSYYKHLFLQTPTIWTGVNEPIPVETNIENGYGVFAAYTLDTVTFVVPYYAN